MESTVFKQYLKKNKKNKIKMIEHSSVFKFFPSISNITMEHGSDHQLKKKEES